MIVEELRHIPSKLQLERFDTASFAKEKIRELFRTGGVPTAESMVEEILLRALKQGAAELHFEPMESDLRIRMGSEGIMRRMVSLPKEITENLANILKARGGLNAFEKKKPQEGKFSTTVGTLQYDIRVSTLPILHGERITLHIIQKNAHVPKLEELGFSTENLDKVNVLLRRPSGLFLITGPSRAGKSKTLYAAVNSIQTAEKNVVTVENLVEYKLDFASQATTPPDKSVSYAEIVRATLQQHPSVVMIGEISDAESGTVATEAALSGSLVLSSMSSVDAVSSIFHLINLGVPSYALASTLIGIVYQQLVQRVCDSCKEEYEPTGELQGTVVNMLAGQKKFFRGKGCEKCERTGYRGRMAIHEVLVINDQIRDLIYEKAPIIKLKEAARASGFQNIFHDAAKRIAAGVTTVDEVTRVMG